MLGVDVPIRDRLPEVSDGRALPLVLVVRHDEAEAGVEPDPVPVRADHVEFGAQHHWVRDSFEVYSP